MLTPYLLVILSALLESKKKEEYSFLTYVLTFISIDSILSIDPPYFIQWHFKRCQAI